MMPLPTFSDAIHTAKSTYQTFIPNLYLHLPAQLLLVTTSMVGRTPKAYMGDRLLSFNLAKPIVPGESKSTPGIQLADIVASAAAYSVNSPNESVSTAWRERLSDAIGERMVLPFIQLIDFRNSQTYVNAAVLWRLVEQSLRGENIFHQMPEFVHGLLIQYQQNEELQQFIANGYNGKKGEAESDAP
jgi:hypothetical protein